MLMVKCKYCGSKNLTLKGEYPPRFMLDSCEQWCEDCGKMVQRLMRRQENVNILDRTKYSMPRRWRNLSMRNHVVAK